GRIRISVKPSARAKCKGVEVRVADSGPGVAAENRVRIFEPFFTTKKDVGTGLGLWVSKEITERHGGTLQLSKEQEPSLGGAVFTVFLPFEAVVAEAVSGVA